MAEYKTTKTVVTEHRLMLHELRGCWNQLPLFLTADAIKTVQWARTLPGQDATLGRRRSEPGTFSIRMLMEFLYPDKDGPWPDDDPRRLHAEEIMHELNAAGMLGDGGYFARRLRFEMAEIVPEACGDCVVAL